MRSVTSQTEGFSIVELIITISIIGILAGIVVFTPKTFLVTARDQERADDTASIARRLEEAYASQDLDHPGYPSTVELSADIAGKSRTMTRLADDALKAPGASSSSIVMATSLSTTAPAGAGSPVLNKYIYQPLTANGALCISASSTANPCIRYFLYYRSEETNQINIIKSMHQQ